MEKGGEYMERNQIDPAVGLLTRIRDFLTGEDVHISFSKMSVYDRRQSASEGVRNWVEGEPPYDVSMELNIWGRIHGE